MSAAQERDRSMAPFVALLAMLYLPGVAGLSLHSVYPAAGSFAGGTHLTITGTGFMMPTDANLWDSQQVGNSS